MATLEEIKREYARLKAEKEVRVAMEKRNVEKKEMAGKLRQLKYARAYSIAGRMKSGAKTIAKGISEDIQRSQAKAIKTKRKAPARRNNGNPFGFSAPQF